MGSLKNQEMTGPERKTATLNRNRMNIAYALASNKTREVFTLLAKKVSLTLDEVAGITKKEEDLIRVAFDLGKAQLANFKGKKFIITSLGLKVAQKLGKEDRK